MARTLNISDSHKIAEIHIKAFPNFFLSDLGYDFLVLFYKSIIKDQNTIAICLEDSHEIIGFAIGTKNYDSFYKKLLFSNFFSFSLVLFKKFVSKPTLLTRMIISFYSSKKVKNISKYRSCLLSICIDPGYSKKGLGSLLIKNFEFYLFKNDIISYFLTTDANNNDSVNKFYIKNNFNLDYTFLQGKRLMNVYVKSIL